MARTKMRVVGSKDKIEIAHHLAALGAFDGPSHAAHPHSLAGELKCLSDWFSVDFKAQVKKAMMVIGGNVHANRAFAGLPIHVFDGAATHRCMKNSRAPGAQIPSVSRLAAAGRFHGMGCAG